jgi:RimJ/RimL family protein N-acetyltransferase
MDNLIKGDEVRRGTQIYLNALTQDVIAELETIQLSEAMLHQLHDGSTPLTPMTAGQMAQAYQAMGGLAFALRLQTDHACIGCCCLANVAWQARHAQLHIGIVDEIYFTRGILLDVIQTILQFAYWEANLNRIYVRCVEDNTLLCDALEQAGFTNEGHLRQEVYRNGHYLDQVIYSILQREWSG